jgi:hypothetical protein
VGGKAIVTLGQLIEHLQVLRDDLPVALPLQRHPGRFVSYRGNYAQLAIEAGDGYKPGFESEGYVMHETVGSLLKAAKAVDGATLTGFKGGEYKMSRSTPIWIADEGDSTNVILADVVIKQGDQGQDLVAFLQGVDVAPYLR